MQSRETRALETHQLRLHAPGLGCCSEVLGCCLAVSRSLFNEKLKCRNDSSLCPRGLGRSNFQARPLGQSLTTWGFFLEFSLHFYLCVCL